MNRKQLSRIWIVGVACVVAGLALAGQHEDFADLSASWEKHYNARDAAGVAALYTENGWVMPPNTEGVQGREAIRAKIEQDLAATEGLTLAVDSVEFGKDGNIGFAHGTYTMKDAGGNVVDSGKWIEVRKKVKGKWLIHADIWNSDLAQGAE